MSTLPFEPGLVMFVVIEVDKVPHSVLHCQSCPWKEEEYSNQSEITADLFIINEGSKFIGYPLPDHSDEIEVWTSGRLTTSGLSISSKLLR
jgi:hypothetical protein